MNVGLVGFDVARQLQTTLSDLTLCFFFFTIRGFTPPISLSEDETSVKLIIIIINITYSIFIEHFSRTCMTKNSKEGCYDY